MIFNILMIAFGLLLMALIGLPACLYYRHVARQVKLEMSKLDYSDLLQ